MHPTTVVNILQKDRVERHKKFVLLVLLPFANYAERLFLVPDGRIGINLCERCVVRHLRVLPRSARNCGHSRLLLEADTWNT